MDPITIIAAVNTAITIANMAIKAGQDAAPFVSAIAGLFKGESVTEEQVAALLAKVNELADEFEKPLPPDDGTTTA